LFKVLAASAALLAAASLSVIGVGGSEIFFYSVAMGVFTY
jgi:hypothetical protein